MKRVLAIIQARLGSTRLPGKVLKKIEDRTALEHVIDRLKQGRFINKIVVATTMSEADKAILRTAIECGVQSFAGNENDVLDRFYQVLKKHPAEVVVRITADCPLMDVELIDETTALFLEGEYDYVSTAYPTPTFPDGLDIEVFSAAVLAKAWQEAKLASEREHVTPYIWKHPEIFKLGIKANKLGDLSAKRWTLDDERDLAFIREIYRYLYVTKRYFNMQDILILLEKHPEIEKLNSGTMRNEGYQKSLKEDKALK